MAWGGGCYSAPRTMTQGCDTGAIDGSVSKKRRRKEVGLPGPSLFGGGGGGELLVIVRNR
jgi:hypothetical protein